MVIIVTIEKTTNPTTDSKRMVEIQMIGKITRLEEGSRRLEIQTGMGGSHNILGLSIENLTRGGSIPVDAASRVTATAIATEDMMTGETTITGSL